MAAVEAIARMCYAANREESGPQDWQSLADDAQGESQS